jgi:peptide/nickel transport system permease protein
MISRYIVRRLLQAIPLLILVSLVIFYMLRLVPGGPLAVYARGQTTPEALAQIRTKLGLDQPLIVQYIHWLNQAIRGDLGNSYDTGRPVLTEIVARLGPTVYLIGSTFLLVLIISLLVGVISAVRQYSAMDIGITTLTFIGQALPVFWIGLMLILIFFSTLTNPLGGGHLLPASGMYTVGKPFNAWDWFVHLILPMVTLGLGWVSWYSRYLRSSMLDVIHQDYIRTARAKGLHERLVVFKHALKNAAIPLVTVVALDLPVLFGGSLFVEIIFSWPGMGRLFYRAVERRDYPILMGTILIIAVMMVTANLIADIVYAYLDPRIRYEE